jgi:hypothetical protein
MADTAQNLISAAQAAGYASLSHRQKLQCLLAGVQSGGALPFTPDVSESIGFFNFYVTTLGTPDLVFNVATSSVGFDIETYTDLETISFPNLTTLGQDAYITIAYLTSLTSVSFPVLTDGGSSINVQDNPDLTTFSAPVLVEVDNGFSIGNCASLGSLSLPSIVTVPNGITVATNAALSSVSLPSWLPTNGSVNVFTGNALNQASVDHILARGVANAAFVSGSVALTGGTNSTPSAAGLADKATLVGRGVTVTNN